MNEIFPGRFQQCSILVQGADPWITALPFGRQLEQLSLTQIRQPGRGVHNDR